MKAAAAAAKTGEVKKLKERLGTKKEFDGDALAKITNQDEFWEQARAMSVQPGQEECFHVTVTVPDDMTLKEIKSLVEENYAGCRYQVVRQIETRIEDRDMMNIVLMLWMDISMKGKEAEETLNRAVAARAEKKGTALPATLLRSFGRTKAEDIQAMDPAMRQQKLGTVPEEAPAVAAPGSGGGRDDRSSASSSRPRGKDNKKMQ